jgi:hypothetical protein
MRLLCFLVCLAFLRPAQAAVEVNPFFRTSINLPEGGGWVASKKDELPQAPNMAFIAFAKNDSKQATFAFCEVSGLPNHSLVDPGTIEAINTLLKGFGYTLQGTSVVEVAKRNWRQFPVATLSGGQPVSGVVRFTEANGHIFMLSMLRGGAGAAQDPDLQAAAATVQFLPPAAVVAATPPGAPGTPPTAPVLNPAAQPKESAPAAEPSADPKLIAVGPWKFTREQVQMIGFSAGGLFVLILLLRIITGGKKPEPPPRPPTRRV